MNQATLHIYLEKIKENTRSVVDYCTASGIETVCVTKSSGGDPEIARAMLDGGCRMLAESRLSNAERLRAAGIEAPILLLRSPAPSSAPETVRYCEMSLESELTTIRALGDAASAIGREHEVILMVELGDLREGILPEDLSKIARETAATPGIRLEGIGSNFGCFGGIVPSTETLTELVDLAVGLRQELGLPLPVVSGGNSFTLPLLEAGGVPRGITHLRLGAPVVLGALPTPPKLKAQIHTDAFILETKIIEIKKKPGRPWGIRGTDAFGHLPEFPDSDAPMLRAIVAAGRQDTVPEDLFPLMSGVRVLGGSSDHIVLDVSKAAQALSPGDTLNFRMEYGALLQSMIASSVLKKYHGHRKKAAPKGGRNKSDSDKT